MLILIQSILKHKSDEFHINFNFDQYSGPSNGLNPIWKDNNSGIFDLICPEMALIRFVVYDEDTFGEPNFVGQATYPVTCLKSGTYWVSKYKCTFLTLLTIVIQVNHCFMQPLSFISYEYLHNILRVIIILIMPLLRWRKGYTVLPFCLSVRNKNFRPRFLSNY